MNFMPISFNYKMCVNLIVVPDGLKYFCVN